MIDLDQQFPLHDQVLYLNHAAVAPWPRRSAEAVKAFAEQNATLGARDYPQWLAVEQRLRQRLATLIGQVDVDEIALLKNTSEGLSVIAQGLDWRPGDQVVISDQEFPSNRIPWQALASQGVEVISVSLAGAEPERDIIAALGPRTRLVSLSSVQYGSGLRLQLESIGQHCRQQGILFCVDAIQQLGALPFDARAVQADFVVADGHKWMLGPEGLALFYCRKACQPLLTLRQHGWHMVAAAGDYSRTDWQPADNSKRFECGSPNMLGVHALEASLSVLEEVGMEQVAAQLQARIEHLYAGLQGNPAITLLSDPRAERRAGIVTLICNDEPAATTFQRLRQAGVVCAERGGGIRLSPHFYTPFATIDAALAQL